MKQRKGYHVQKKLYKKISESKKGRCLGKENHFYGKKHTEESKQKISKTHKGKTISLEQRTQHSLYMLSISKEISQRNKNATKNRKRNSKGQFIKVEKE